MSGDTADNRYTLNDVGTNRMSLKTAPSTLPKTQPVRLKTLLRDSDEDDDDDNDNDNDNDNENEESHESKDKKNEDSDFEELSQDDSAEDESSLFDANFSSLMESTDKLSKVTRSVPKETREVVTDISVHKEISCAIDKEECKVDSANFKSHLLIGDGNEAEAYRHEGIAQKCHNNTFPLKNHQTDVHNSSIDVVLPSPTVYKGDYDVKSDTNKNLQSTNSAHNENAHISDVLKQRKEEYMYNMPVESNAQLPRSDGYVLNLKKEDSRYKSGHSITEQASKDCEEESRAILNSESEIGNCISQTSGNLNPARVMKYEANEKYTPAKSLEHSTPSLSETGKTMINRSVLETPLKHLQPMMHPNPSTSHKQLFQTPYSKPSSDPSMNLAQTPSTVFSSGVNNERQILMEGKNFVTKDHVQPFRNIIYTPREINEKLGQRFVIRQNN